MAQDIIQPSFAAGELSPSLYGRTDLSQYHIGVALARNFFVDYRGGLATKPGTIFVGRAGADATTVRVIPFRFSNVQAYALEFGNQYMRVIKNAAYVLNAAKTITAMTNASPGVFTSAAHGFTNGQQVYLSALPGTTGLAGRNFFIAGATTNTFTLTDLWGTAINTTSVGTFTGSGTIASIFQLATPYAYSDLFLLKFSQSADVMTLTHPNYVTENLTRLADNNWTLTQYNPAASLSAPTGVAVSPITTGGTGISLIYPYMVTALTADGTEESNPSLIVRATNYALNQNVGCQNNISWTAVSGSGNYKVYKATPYAASNGIEGTLYGYIGQTQNTSFNDNNIAADFTRSPPQHQNPFAPGQIINVNPTAGGSGYAPATTTVSITTSTGSGFVGLPIITAGAFTGVYILNAGINYAQTDTLVVASTGGGTGAAGTLNVGANTGMYPGVNSYFQQRKWFAAQTSAPETLNASQVGLYNNMDIHDPVQSDDALSLTINSNQVNTIKSLVPMNAGLLAFTSGGIWQISGGVASAGTPVTPSNAQGTPQSYNEASDIPPIVINYDILYVQQMGSIVRDVSYNFYQNTFTGDDLTISSNHLFFGYTIIDSAYAEEPYKIIYYVRNDGQLLVFTFLKEQQVKGWAHWDTDGLYQSVCSIPEGGENAVYFVVKRFINGQWVQFIERLASRNFKGLSPQNDVSYPENAWCVDAGLQYPLVFPAATATPSGISGSITVTASAAVFAAGDVGKVMRVGGGIGTVTAYNSATSVTVNLTTPITSYLPNNALTPPIPQLSGTWSMTMPVKTVSGLYHLEGKKVAVLADGNVAPQQTVVNGTITLPQACSLITVGLPFQCQMQTLYLDFGEPTQQGQFKKLNQVIARVEDSRGMKVGSGPTTIVANKDRTNQLYGQPIPLFTGDWQVNLDPLWGRQGQLFFQIDDPVPFKLLAIIPDVTVGDNRR